MHTKHLLATLLIFPFSLCATGSKPVPAATSALQFQQQSDTKVTVGDNIISFFTGATERMTLDANGNVGIGTASPGGQVEIKGPYSGNSQLIINSTLSNAELKFSDNGVPKGFVWYDKGNDLMAFGRGSVSNSLFVSSSGNVGIGTTDPGNYLLNTNGSFIATTFADVGLFRPSTANTEGLFVKGVDGNGFANFHLATDSYSGSHAILFNAYKSGTQVTGSIAATGNSKFTHNVGSYGGGAGMIHFYGNGGGMQFYVSDVSTGADTSVDWGMPKMHIQRNGTVAINTVTPNSAYKLHVEGTIHATNYSAVSPPSWPDYVFEDNYELNELEQVEKYIEKNHHLPEIPSAAEVQENGVDIVSMQAKLLQKIEELTLYVIDLKKENEDLLKRTQKLESQIRK